MNILTIAINDSQGGGAVIPGELQKALQQKGYSVSMFVHKKFTDNPLVHEIPQSTFQKKTAYYLANDIDFSHTDYILNTPEFKNADIVHIHNLHGGYFNLSTLKKMSARKPVLWTLHDMWALTAHCAHSRGGVKQNGFYPCGSINEYPQTLFKNDWYLEWKKGHVYAHSDVALITPSEWLKEKVSQSVLKNKPIHVIPNGIDTDLFKPTSQNDARKELHLPRDKKIILFISSGGKKNPFKGWSYMEKVREQYKQKTDVLFVCIGGKENIHYENSFQVPSVDRALLAKYYSASDMLLFTSVAENFPLVILEAMSSGLPIVSFDVGGVKEALIHKQNGYIAEYLNIEEVCNGIEYIRGLTATELQTMKLNSRTRAEKLFSVETMATEYVRVYTEIIARKKNTK